MKRTVDICVEAGDEQALDAHEAELAALRDEVRELALKFPVPGIN